MATTKICSIPECGKRRWARGWCEMHYQRWRAHGSPHIGAANWLPSKCAAPGCSEPPNSRYKGGDAFCNKHLLRVMKYGCVELPLRPPAAWSTCSFAGCEKKARSRSGKWCEMHYGRVYRGVSLEERIPAYSLDQDAFSAVSSAEAWLMGMIWSDGNLRKNVVSVTSKDWETLAQAEIVLGGCNLIKERDNPMRHWVLGFTSAAIASRLRGFGLHEAKSFSIGWPVSFPEKMRWHFIRGLWDGDGWASIFWRPGARTPGLRLGLCGASKALIDATSDRLTEGGIHHRRDISQRMNPLYRIIVNRQDAQEKLFRLFYGDAKSPRMKRKFEAWRDYLAIPNRGYAGRTVGNLPIEFCRSRPDLTARIPHGQADQ